MLTLRCGFNASADNDSSTYSVKALGKSRDKWVMDELQ